MELKNLIERATEIRNKYQKLEQKLHGKTWGTEQLMGGLVTDIGNLMRVVMAKEGYRQLKDKDIDKELAHQFSDCLWSLLVLSSKYDINLEKEFLRTMDLLDEAIENKEKDLKTHNITKSSTS